MDEGTINAEVTMGGAVGVLLVNRYRVLKQLGQGGMGSVWLAEDTKLDGRKVAVKMLPSILVSNKRAYAQVKQEALVSLKLTHSNIVAVRAFEEEGGNPFLVMDYIEGRTLDDYLAEKGKLTEEETIRLLKPIAAALDYAHAQGVVHRDVKPGNVMIDKSGHPYVLDFGIAREIQETMTRVTGKLSSGTLLYMSPEQLNGDAPKPAQDVFSFAAMAYECLTGSPPFTRGGIEDQIKHKTPEALGPQFIKCGQGVMAGLAKSSESRPVTCAAVLSVGSRVPRDRAGDGAAARRTRIAAVLLGALAILSLVGVGGWLWREKSVSDELAAERARQVEIATREAARQKAEAERIAAEKTDSEQETKEESKWEIKDTAATEMKQRQGRIGNQRMNILGKWECRWTDSVKTFEEGRMCISAETVHNGQYEFRADGTYKFRSEAKTTGWARLSHVSDDRVYTTKDEGTGRWHVSGDTISFSQVASRRTMIDVSGKESLISASAQLPDEREKLVWRREGAFELWQFERNKLDFPGVGEMHSAKKIDYGCDGKGEFHSTYEYQYRQGEALSPIRKKIKIRSPKEFGRMREGG